MATITITITPDVGQAQTATITVPQADATRVLQAYQALNAGATLQNLVQYFAQILIQSAIRLVQSNVAIPASPVMTQNGTP